MEVEKPEFRKLWQRPNAKKANGFGAEAVRRYAGSLSPSGGAATSNAFTTPHSIA